MSRGHAAVVILAIGAGPPDLGRRARFLAWAASRVVLDLGTRDRAAECASALRQATSLPTSSIALVLMDEDLALRPTSDREALRTSVRLLGAAMVASGRRDAKDIDALANATLEERAVPWLVIAASAVVVVPRLSAMADSAGLTKEIEEEAGAPVRWVHAP